MLSASMALGFARMPVYAEVFSNPSSVIEPEGEEDYTPPKTKADEAQVKQTVTFSQLNDESVFIK